MPSKYYGSFTAVKALGEFENPMSAVVADCLLNRKDAVEGITSTLTQSMFTRADAYYKYGLNTYSRGVPVLNGVRDKLPYAAIKQAISVLVGSPVILVYVTKSLVENDELLTYLTGVRGYNSVTRRISNYPPVLIDFGPSITNCVYVGVTSVAGVTELTYQYSGENIEGTVTESVNISALTQDTYNVGFYLQDSAGNAVGELQLWFHRLDDQIPGLSHIPAVKVTQDSGYYPIVPFYEGTAQIGNSANAAQPLYQQSKQLVKKLGTKYEDMVASLAEGTAESVGKNKGLYAYLGFFADVTLPIHKNLSATPTERINHAFKHKGSIVYLAEFFSSVILNNDYLEFADASGNGYKSRFKVTDISSQVLAYTETEGAYGASFEEAYTERLITPDYASTELQPYTVLDDSSKLTYWYRVAPGLRKIVVVTGLMQEVAAHRKAAVVIYPKESFKAEPTLVCLPVSRDIVNAVISQKDKTALLHSCLMFTFAAYQRQEIKWYETGLFKIVVVFVALVLAVPSGGASIKTAVFLLSVGEYALFVYFILMEYIAYLTVKAVIKKSAELLGPEALYVLAIVSMAYGKFSSSDFAKHLMTLGNELLVGTSNYIRTQYNKLQKEYAAYLTESAKLQKELDDAQKAFDLTKELDFDVMGSPPNRFRFGATADEMLAVQTELSTNSLALNVPDIYANLMLRLPTIDDSLNTPQR